MNAAEFNALYEVGVPVFAYPGARPEDGGTRLVTRTREKAEVLSGHTDVVWVEGHGACIQLSHVDVVSEDVWEAARTADAVAAMGTEPQALSGARLTEIREHVAGIRNWSLGNLAARDLLAEVEHSRARIAELEAHGIAGTADALPMPVGPKPQLSERDRLRSAFIAALDEAHQTHPCPATGRPYWLGCVHYDESGRMTGVGSCHEERRADAVLAVRDVEMERLRARIAELESERHSTNEALSDAAEALRARQVDGCSCPPADRLHQVGCSLDGAPASSERPVNELTAAFMPMSSLREDAEQEAVRRSVDAQFPLVAELLRDGPPPGEHYNATHHDYRTGRELPGAGGA